jgi:hypothetical protein
VLKTEKNALSDPGADKASPSVVPRAYHLDEVLG